jgi:hypothetical protein
VSKNEPALAGGCRRCSWADDLGDRNELIERG